MRPGMVVRIRVNPRDSASVVDIARNLGIYDSPNISYSALVSSALASLLDAAREVGMIPDRDGFDYEEAMGKFLVNTARRGKQQLSYVESVHRQGSEYQPPKLRPGSGWDNPKPMGTPSPVAAKKPQPPKPEVWDPHGDVPLSQYKHHSEWTAEEKAAELARQKEDATRVSGITPTEVKKVLSQEEQLHLLELAELKRAVTTLRNKKQLSLTNPDGAPFSVRDEEELRALEIKILGGV